MKYEKPKTGPMTEAPGILDILLDRGSVESVPGFSDHYKYYREQVPQIIRQFEPDYKRVDRGLFDVITNYMGGYDAAARAPQNLDELRTLSKAYQYGDVLMRPNDASHDYIENIAGIDAYNQDVGRVPDAQLYEMAKRYAEEKLSQPIQQDYSEAEDSWKKYPAYVLRQLAKSLGD